MNLKLKIFSSQTVLIITFPHETRAVGIMLMAAHRLVEATRKLYKIRKLTSNITNLAFSSNCKMCIGPAPTCSRH